MAEVIGGSIDSSVFECFDAEAAAALSLVGHIVVPDVLSEQQIHDGNELLRNIDADLWQEELGRHMINTGITFRTIKTPARHRKYSTSVLKRRELVPQYMFSAVVDAHRVMNDIGIEVPRPRAYLSRIQRYGPGQSASPHIDVQHNVGRKKKLSVVTTGVVISDTYSGSSIATIHGIGEARKESISYLLTAGDRLYLKGRLSGEAFDEDQLPCHGFEVEESRLAISGSFLEVIGARRSNAN